MSELEKSCSPTTEQTTQTLFDKGLATYRKVTVNNLMYHREVYAALHQILIEEMVKPFTFLDIACGDASASARALQGTAVNQYIGIDLSRPSLELADRELKSLPCKVRLECRDFVEALYNWTEPVDAAWVGMSIHHLHHEAKREFMRTIRQTLRDDGLFMIWEPTCLDGEDRLGWMDRFCAERDNWRVLTDEEFEAMNAHNRLADFPETAARWHKLGRDAGFVTSREFFFSPNRLARGYVYQVR